MVPTNDAQTAHANPPTETNNTVVAIGAALYVDISSFQPQIMFANVSFYEKVQCKGGKWTEVLDCGNSPCHGGKEGGALC